MSWNQSRPHPVLHINWHLKKNWISETTEQLNNSHRTNHMDQDYYYYEQGRERKPRAVSASHEPGFNLRRENLKADLVMVWKTFSRWLSDTKGEGEKTREIEAPFTYMFPTSTLELQTRDSGWSRRLGHRCDRPCGHKTQAVPAREQCH